MIWMINKTYMFLKIVFSLKKEERREGGGHKIVILPYHN
jgi:hypothetical protein